MPKSEAYMAYVRELQCAAAKLQWEEKLISTKFTEKGQTITTYKELLLYINQNKHNN